MAEVTGNTAGQAETGQTNQATSPAGAQNTETQATETTGPGPVPYERFSELTAKLRKAEKALADSQKAQEDKQRAEMSEVERLRKDIQDREAKLEAAATQLRNERLQRAFSREAEKLKLRWANPEALDDAFRLADLETVTVEEDGGRIDGMEAVLKALAKTKPYLFAQVKAQDTDGGAGTGTGGTPIVDKSKWENELRQRFNIRG